MLVMGFTLGNVPGIKQFIVIDPKWSSTIRSISLVVILTRAGLGLDPGALRRLKTVIPRLGPLPAVMEAVSCAVAAHFLLGFSWEFSFVQGFVLSAVSVAIVVPAMLQFQEKGLGTDKGIPTLLMASATIDNVLAIVSHAVLLGAVFSKGSLVWKILRGPVEVLVGLVYGVGMGAIMWYLPVKDAETFQRQRFLVLLSAALFAVFVGKSVELPGAGALGCLVLAFVAGLGWRRRDITSGEAKNRVPLMFARLWKFFQPFLFGLIGYEIDFGKIDASTVGLGIAVLFIGLVARCATVLLVTMGAGFCVKERAFMALASLPKATVQAAIGSLAYDMAKERGLVDEQEIGLKILTIAVISILIAVPMGSGAIQLSAKRFLHRTSADDKPELTRL